MLSCFQFSPISEVCLGSALARCLLLLLFVCIETTGNLNLYKTSEIRNKSKVSHCNDKGKRGNTRLEQSSAYAMSCIELEGFYLFIQSFLYTSYTF